MTIMFGESIGVLAKLMAIELVSFHINDAINPATIAPNMHRRGVGG